MRTFAALLLVGMCLGVLAGVPYGIQFGFWSGVGMFFFLTLFWLAAVGILSVMFHLLDWADRKR